MLDQFGYRVFGVIFDCECLTNFVFLLYKIMINLYAKKRGYAGQNKGSTVCWNVANIK